MKYWMIILYVVPTLVKTITITPNGNSPETKMTRKESLYHFDDSVMAESIQDKKYGANLSKKYHAKLAINERYRRLIPYMTFYYANDLITPTENYNTKNVEVQKAEIVETATLPSHEREPKVIYSQQQYKNIPRYFGNRLTQYNIASSNPSKLYYKTFAPVPYNPQKIPTNFVSTFQEPNTFENSQRTYERLIPKPFRQSGEHYIPTRRPYFNTYNKDDNVNVQYYSSEKEESPTYKLVPYDQTPPVKIIPQTKYISVPQKQYEVAIPDNHVFIKSKVNQPQFITYDTHQEEEKVKKDPAIVSEVYYEQQPVTSDNTRSIILENGFKPIIDPSVGSTEAEVQSEHTLDINKHTINGKKQEIQYDVSYRPQYITEKPFKTTQQDTSNSVKISGLIQSLQLNKAIPKQITRNNVNSSIRTLLQVLNTLKVMSQQNNEPSIVKDETITKSHESSPIYESQSVPSLIEAQNPEFHEEPYLAEVETPSQHLDETSNGSGSSQRFPLLINSDDEGGTPGKPGVDYPILTVIPETSFKCKTQRYKGFFADTETRCQVWHYCDLNGGQASFLCPNGTIFSQAALTCDWWFNVRCSSTAQLYVLNESLYKFILPHSPKFPEDYSGPLVDKYLTLKFKEMEEQFRKNKKKTDKDDDSDDSTEEDVTSSTKVEVTNEESSVQQGNVSVQSVGHSGNVQRLQDD